MTIAVAQAYHLAIRDLRNSLRQPSYVVATLIQPVAWLLLFGKLFAPLMERTATTGSYLTFLTPGIVAMTAVFASGWSGMIFVTEMEQGTLNRFLVTPVLRGALIAGRLVQQAVIVLAQSLLIIPIGLATGARFHGGILIVLVFLGGVMLCSVAFASLSNTLGLLIGRHQAVASITQFLVLPLTFLSEVFMPRHAMPGWMSTIVTSNPVNWLVEIGRQAERGHVDWGQVLDRSAGLLVIALACAWLSTLAFRFYQRQV
jgi:ABC-2 type transport system permease protein